MMESPVQCGCNAHAAPGFFSLAGTAVKASGTDAQPDAAGSVLRGLGSSPTSRKSLSCHESPACRRVDSKKSFKIWKNFRLILFVSWSRI